MSDLDDLLTFITSDPVEEAKESDYDNYIDPEPYNSD